MDMYFILSILVTYLWTVKMESMLELSDPLEREEEIVYM
jgi:hypothetical protein